MQERLQRSLQLSALPPADFVAAMLPSMFSSGAPADRVAAFAANVAGFHFYTFNELGTTERWRRQLLERLGGGA